MSEPALAPRVVITRSPDQAPTLAEKVAARGLRPLLFPVIEFAPLPAPEFDAALRRIEHYDWLVFTSVNAVEFFFRRAGPLDPAGLPPVAAIGSATGAALTRRGITSAFTPAEFSGEALAAGLGHAARASGRALAGTRLLLPRARIGRPEIVQLLEEQGAAVDDIALYDTVTASPSPAAFATLALGFEAIIFTSPSSVRNFLVLIAPHPAIGDYLGQAIIAAIGPVTAAAARSANLSVAVTPAAYTIEAVADALASHLLRAAASVSDP